MLKKSHLSLTASLLPLAVINPELILNKNEFIINALNSINYSISTGLFLLFVYLGTIFPDYDRYFKFLLPKNIKNLRYLYHRQFTHSLLIPIILLYLALFKVNNIFEYAILLGFSFGLISHLIGDMITGSVPILFYAKYYVRFSRIGITIFLPKVLHKYFTEKLPKYLNKNLWIFFINFIIVSIFVLYTYNFFNLL